MQSRSGWTFLSNHSHVLIALASDPAARIRDLAVLVGITERAVVQILVDLEGAGVIEKRKTGRRNVYAVNPGVHLRHPIEQHRTVRDLLRLAAPEELSARNAAPHPSAAATDASPVQRAPLAAQRHRPS